ncbi:unnamed protein product, partial [Polarella glacialis]
MAEQSSSSTPDPDFLIGTDRRAEILEAALRKNIQRAAVQEEAASFNADSPAEGRVPSQSSTPDRGR